MATLIKRKDAWMLNYIDFNGKRVRKTLGKITKAHAEVELEKITYKLRNNTPADYKQTIKYSAYSNTYLKWYERNYPSSSKNKIDNFVNHIDGLFGDGTLDELEKERVEDWIDEKKEKGFAPATINRVLSDLRAFLNHAAEDKYEVVNFKIAGLPDNDDKPAKYHSQKDLEKLYKNSPNNWHWWKFLANTGLRLGELRNLKVEDIDGDVIKVVSTNERRTKSGKFRVVPLNDNAKQALAKFDQSGEFLFPRFHRSSVGTALTRACKRAGIKSGKWGVHCLRHSFGSHLAMNGIHMRAIQKLMGHAKVTTTERYIHLSPEYLVNTVSKINI